MSWDTDGRIDPDLGASLPGHLILLVRHGIYIMENLFLEDLARDQVYDFFLSAYRSKYKARPAHRYVPWPLCLSVKERMCEHGTNHSCHWEYQWLWSSDS